MESKFRGRTRVYTCALCQGLGKIDEFDIRTASCDMTVWPILRLSVSVVRDSTDKNRISDCFRNMLE